MSAELEPIYGIDISDWQRGINLKKAAAEGYEFCVVKASEGPYPDGDHYLNPSYQAQIEGASAAGMLTGAYHYIVEAPAEPQVDLFLKTAGDLSGKLVMIDYEPYPNYPHLDPTMATLAAFVRILKQRIGLGHPVLLYAGVGYWDSPPPNGPVTGLGVTTWDAYYPLGSRSGTGPELYAQAKRHGWGERWGGQEPKIWQFSGTGSVAGMEVDVNAFSGTKEELRALAGADDAAANTGAEDERHREVNLEPDERGWLKDPKSGEWARARGLANAKIVTDSDGWLWVPTQGPPTSRRR